MEDKDRKIKMRSAAIDTTDLAHYTGTPWSNALNTAYEMAGYVMELTTDVHEETLSYRMSQLKNYFENGR